MQIDLCDRSFLRVNSISSCAWEIHRKLLFTAKNCQRENDCHLNWCPTLQGYRMSLTPFLSSCSRLVRTKVEDMTMDTNAIVDKITIVIYTLTVFLGVTGNSIVIWVASFKLKVGLWHSSFSDHHFVSIIIC